MELGRAYADTLPASHRQALVEAANELIDTTLRDLEASDLPDWRADNWLIGSLLPPRYVPKYTAQFARKFFACFMTVVWKLGQPKPMLPSCTAEELAVHVLIKEAKAILEQQGIKADFGDFEDAYFEDVDLELLYSNAFDGIEETEKGQEMGMVNLAFKDWFTRFGEGQDSIYTEIHPFAQPDQE